MKSFQFRLSEHQWLNLGIFSSLLLMQLWSLSHPTQAIEKGHTSFVRNGRLFSNPFGILGHGDCQSDLIGRKGVNGICYNEVECIVRGGRFNGYCGPPAVTGVCCLFITNRCDVTIKERVAHFTNPSFPYYDSAPNACVLKISMIKNACWVKFDFDEFELSTTNTGGCLLDSMTIINSAGGHGGKICGNKKSYSYLAQASKDSPLGLSVVVQSPSYRWSIKITQLECQKTPVIPTFENCGQTGAEGINRAVLKVPKWTENSKGKKVRRKKKVRSSIVSEVCLKNGDACNLIQSAASHTPEKKSKFYAVPNSITKNGTSNEPVAILRRKFGFERYYPAFSTRDLFCKSKFRDNIVKNDPLFKIIDGTEAPVNAFPWIVSLQYQQSHFCGGSLITKEYVITAAHCLEFGNLDNFLEDLKVRFGEHNVFVDDEIGTDTRNVKQVIMHWQFDNIPGSPGDIAILRLDRPIDFTRQISPVCLPTDTTQTFERMLGIAAGWGVTELGFPSDVLRQVELNIIPNITCVQNLGVLNVDITADMICTFKGPMGTESICSGDSGGPLMVRSGSKFTLVGISSFSVTDCSAPFPAVFSRVTYFLRWISAALLGT